MARNIAPEVTDDDCEPAVTLDLPGEISADLTQLARRVHDLFWPLSALR